MLDHPALAKILRLAGAVPSRLAAHDSSFSLAPPPAAPERTGKKLRVRAWPRSPGRRASSQRLEGRGPSAWRPKPRLRMKFQLSDPPAVLPYSRTKLRSRIGDIVRHSVGEGHSVGKSCPALSSELGLMLLTAQVVRGSVGSRNVMVGDRLELDACDLELVCTLYLVPSTFEVSASVCARIAW